ncbi:MAG TPA: 3-oxoacyl-ACP synthase, partial [Actinopolymorphaceae bacterium]
MISSTPGSPHAQILGIGGYRPSRIVTNEEICERIDSSDLWIRTRSGIATRRWASDEETVRAMATAAAGKALAHAGVGPEQVGCVLIASVSHFYQTPALAPSVAYDVGATTAAALDINAGCAAFCYGLELAQSMVRGGTTTSDAPYVLMVGVERLSDLTDLEDRSTAFLFGDGAGAAVVGPSDTPEIGPVVWGSDGSQSALITQKESWDVALTGNDYPYLTMQGNAVFRW